MDKLHEEVKGCLTKAMKDGQQDVVLYCRNVIDVAQKIQKDEREPEMTSKIMERALRRQVKQLHKACDQLRSCETGVELADEYELEINFCEQYLPAETDLLPEMCEAVKEAIEKTGATSSNDFGKVMGFVMKSNQGFDGAEVKKLVKTELDKRS